MEAKREVLAAQSSPTPTSAAPHFLESFGGTIPGDGKRRKR